MTGGNSSAGVAIVDIACRFPGAAAWEAVEDAGKPVGSSARPVGVFTGLGGVVGSYLSFEYPSARKPGEFGASCGDDMLDILADLMTVL